MRRKMVKISIVISTYHRPEFLQRLLQSIQRQSYKDFEVIVIDDCSKNKDDYKQVIQEGACGFKHFHYFRNEKITVHPTHVIAASTWQAVSGSL